MVLNSLAGALLILTCSFTFLLSRLTFLTLKSIPTVEMKLLLNIWSENRLRIEVFPTEESPIRITWNANRVWRYIQGRWASSNITQTSLQFLTKKMFVRRKTVGKNCKNLIEITAYTLFFIRTSKI